MGLLFGKKSSEGNVLSSKRVSDHDIDRKDILGISRKLAFTRTGARQEFQKIIDKAQTGGVTREEVHEGLQRMILDGHLTKDQAHRMARELGLERKDLTRFEDISEAKDHQKNGGEETAEKHPEFGKNTLKEKLDSSGRRVGNNSGFSGTTTERDHLSSDNKSAIKDKPTSIWSILNSRKN